MARPSIGAHCSGASSLTERSGVRPAVAAPRWSWVTERSPRPPLSIDTAWAAAAGTASAARVRSATEARILRATPHASTPPAATPASALEEELGLVVVDEEAHLFGEGVVLLQRGVVVDDVEGDLSCPADP